MKTQSLKFGNTFVKICIARFSFFSFTLGVFCLCIYSSKTHILGTICKTWCSILEIQQDIEWPQDLSPWGLQILSPISSLTLRKQLQIKSPRNVIEDITMILLQQLVIPSTTLFTSCLSSFYFVKWAEYLPSSCYWWISDYNNVAHS